MAEENAKFFVGLNTDTNPKSREVYTIALLRGTFEGDAGFYKPDGRLTVYIPTDIKTKNKNDLKGIPESVLATCNNMYQVMFGKRKDFSKEGFSGMIRGQILTFFAANGCSDPVNTKLIGIEVFSDLRYLEARGYLEEGDYSYDAIDVRSSLESMIEIRHHVGKNKQQILEGVVKLGLIPGEKVNPVPPDDPLYSCYECLKIYNGLLRYGRNKV